jgi:hypothetical protein
MYNRQKKRKNFREAFRNANARLDGIYPLAKANLVSTDNKRLLSRINKQVKTLAGIRLFPFPTRVFD